MPLVEAHEGHPFTGAVPASGVKAPSSSRTVGYGAASAGHGGVSVNHTGGGHTSGRSSAKPSLASASSVAVGVASASGGPGGAHGRTLGAGACHRDARPRLVVAPALVAFRSIWCPRAPGGGPQFVLTGKVVEVVPQGRSCPSVGQAPPLFYDYAVSRPHCAPCLLSQRPSLQQLAVAPCLLFSVSCVTPTRELAGAGLTWARRWLRLRPRLRRRPVTVTACPVLLVVPSPRLVGVPLALRKTAPLAPRAHAV